MLSRVRGRNRRKHLPHPEPSGRATLLKPSTLVYPEMDMNKTVFILVNDSFISSGAEYCSCGVVPLPAAGERLLSLEWVLSRGSASAKPSATRRGKPILERKSPSDGIRQKSDNTTRKNKIGLFYSKEIPFPLPRLVPLRKTSLHW